METKRQDVFKKVGSQIAELPVSGVGIYSLSLLRDPQVTG